MTETQANMLKITGYSDRFSARPGETIRFHINSEENESFQADMVRLIHGDTNPAGPGYKEELIESPLSGTHAGRHQPIYAGSYIFVPHTPHFDLQSFTLCAYIYPTTPLVDTEGVVVGPQGLLTKWDAGARTEMLINDIPESIDLLASYQHE